MSDFNYDRWIVEQRRRERNKRTGWYQRAKAEGRPSYFAALERARERARAKRKSPKPVPAWRRLIAERAETRRAARCCDSGAVSRETNW